jgi:hypothetical protein
VDGNEITFENIFLFPDGSTISTSAIYTYDANGNRLIDETTFVSSDGTVTKIHWFPRCTWVTHTRT